MFEGQYSVNYICLAKGCCRRSISYCVSIVVFGFNGVALAAVVRCVDGNCLSSGREFESVAAAKDWVCTWSSPWVMTDCEIKEPYLGWGAAHPNLVYIYIGTSSSTRIW